MSEHNAAQSSAGGVVNRKKKRQSSQKQRVMNEVVVEQKKDVYYKGSEGKTESVSIPAGYNVDVKICEMGSDMTKLALLIVITCMQQDFDSSEIAQELKNSFDAACPLEPWHAVVGEAYYAIATHRKGYYLFFCINKMKVILYKCREQD